MILVFGKNYSARDLKPPIKIMSSTSTNTQTETYSVVDIEATFRRFKTDLLMIADSTASMTREQAENYAYDAEYLAKKGYLKSVDVTLIVNSVEKKAARYTVTDLAKDLENSRPGGVLWPRFDGGKIRVILSYSESYTAAHKENAKKHLKINWTPTSEDISHPNLTSNNGRNFISNAYGIQRNDYST